MKRGIRVALCQTPVVQPDQQRAHTLDAYERLAGVWDDTDDNLWNEALERASVRRLLPIQLGGLRVLDAGCASGAHAAWLAQHGCAVVALDRSPLMVTQARARLGGGAGVVADLGQLPFAPRAFDGIVCSLALHYLEDMATALAWFAQILRPGGWLVLTLDHPFGPVSSDTEPDYFATRLVTDTWEKRGVVVTQAFYRRPLSAVTDDLADAGFVIERIDEPKVGQADVERFGAEAAEVQGRPTFIAYLARRTS